MALDAVDRVLAERGHAAGRSRRAEMAALGFAALLHLGVVAVAFGLARFKPHSEPIEYVAAQIVPAQALGVEKPRKRAEAPKPEPPGPTPEPAAEPEPEPPAPEPVAKPAPTPPPVPTGPLPRPKGWNDPVPTAPAPVPAKPAAPAPTKPAAPTPPTAKPPTPAKPGSAAGSPGPGAEVAKGNEAGPRGSSAGTAAGTSPFGDRIASIDPDFTYGYYIEQLLRQIDAKWTPPQAGTNIRTIVRFRILRRGNIEQLDVAESSGINAFDLAALRAVQNASPFPPLPASYRNPFLDVNLIVR
ncbi:MAG TPA: energy transducer TonB [Thermoanaerobaculia bacterium]|jgi:protein TonB|nr:energy transducer TonB [Thermoanaerobaculia bacterium]